VAFWANIRPYIIRVFNIQPYISSFNNKNKSGLRLVFACFEIFSISYLLHILISSSPLVCTKIFLVTHSLNNQLTIKKKREIKYRSLLLCCLYLILTKATTIIILQNRYVYIITAAALYRVVCFKTFKELFP